MAWKDIPGYEGLYKASTDGRIKSMGGHAPRVLSPALKQRGYYHLILCRSGQHGTHSVHRLIALTFLGTCPVGFDVNHKDGVKTNCSVNNLEYVSRSENHKHAYRLGLRTAPRSMLGRLGAMHPNSKAIAQLDKRLVTIKTFGSIREAERNTGVFHSNISACCLGKKKYAGGFVWNHVTQPTSHKKKDKED